MKQVINVFLIVAFCLPVYQLSAQKKTKKARPSDFLVTINNDTLYGRYKKAVLKPAYFLVNGKKLPLDPQLFTSYYTNKKLYRSIAVSPRVTPQWMECLEDGVINLYQYVMVNASHPGPPSNDVIWLARKNTGPLLNVNGVMASQAIAEHNLQQLIEDKPSVKAAAIKQPFNWRLVQELIHQYNHTP